MITTAAAAPASMTRVCRSEGRFTGSSIELSPRSIGRRSMFTGPCPWPGRVPRAGRTGARADRPEPRAGALAAGGHSAARDVVPAQGEQDDRGHDHQHRGQMPQEPHSGRRTGRRVSSLRPTRTIHLQRRATCTGTRKSVTSAVRKCSSVQNGPVSG